jgi:hypothetical protein
MATEQSRDTASAEPAGMDERVREISLEEFNPSGTLALLGVYFLILMGMWLFMYFVEFAGRGVSIIG